MLGKSRIRERILLKRRSLKKAEIIKMSRKIQNRLFSLPEFKESTTISIYVDFDNEVGTKDIIRDSIYMGKRVSIPYTKGKKNSLLLSEIRDIDKELETSTFGILEPKKEYFRYIPDNEIDVVIVPGIAFDEKGRRLGYGGGYYDRLLIKLNRDIVTIGLAFEFQILSEIPWWFYDIFIDKIITERRLINCYPDQYSKENL
jgi:5-formyltetrahydrofolate cyclo-ligase